MRILLPTDFSTPSVIPVYYAAKLARKINAEIILFHALNIDYGPREDLPERRPRLLEAMQDNALADLQALADKLKNDVDKDLKVTCETMLGDSVASTIKAFAGSIPVDLIVMGTKGASGLKKVLMGSNTAEVIGESDIPVIAVPELAYFNNIHKIVYASDFQDVDNEIKALLPFARLFQASIQVLHIVSPEFVEEIDTSVLLNDLLEEQRFPEISVHTKVSADVISAIDAFIKESEANILAMFTHKPTFSEKLFGKSITREMAFHSKVALLTLQKATDETNESLRRPGG